MNYLELWNSAWPAAVTMLSLGTGFAVILLIASKKLKVKVDPQIERVQQALPQIDCGACGFAGCASYAKAVVQQPDLIGKCAPGGQKTSEKIAEETELAHGLPSKVMQSFVVDGTCDTDLQRRYRGL